MKKIVALRRKNAGFTLIELMIVAVVVAVLASIAYPSYRESIAKGKRVQAKNMLSQAQQWLERQYSENYRYDKTLDGKDVDNTAGGVFNSQFGVAPVPAEGAAAYNIKLETKDSGRTYTLTAERTGSMASDRCGDYVLTSTGRKSVINHSFGPGAAANLEATQRCW